MLHYTIVFADHRADCKGALGFFGVAGLAASVAKILFFIFLVLFVVGLVTGRRSV